MNRRSFLMGAAISPAVAVTSAFAVQTSIDASGATTDLVKALPGILRQQNQQLEREIVEKLRRGQIGS